MTISILFVCLANVCRSPAAVAITRKWVEEKGLDIRVDSCGLGSWHAGHQADARMIDTAKIRGFHIVSKAKPFQSSYLDEFDYLLGVDHEIVQELYLLSKTPEHKAKVQLLTHFSESYKDEDIPDPYYLGEPGFENVLDMLEDSCLGLLEKLEHHRYDI